MKKILLMIMIMFAVSICVFGQRATALSKQEQEVLKINQQYDEAIANRNVAEYERILADDFIYTDSDGKVVDKAQEIAKVKSRNTKLESGKSDDVRIKIYGNTAVVTGRYIAKGQNNGKEFIFYERYTCVYAKQNGKWQMVAAHSSEEAQK